MRKSFILSGLFLANCSSTQSVRVEAHAPTQPLRVLVVLPVQLLYKFNPSEDALRTNDLLRSLWSETNWVILPPSNFTVVNQLVDDPILKTDALLQLERTSKYPDSIGVLNTAVSYREARGQAIITSQSQAAGDFAYQLQVVVSMSLVGTGGSTLLEFETVQEVDPFAIRPDYDNRPEVVEALRASVARLLDHAEDWIEAGQTFSFTGTPTLAALEKYSHTQTSSTAKAQADPIQAQLRTWYIARYLNPALEFNDMEDLENLPPGVCLDSESIVEPFTEGDCILRLGDTPLYSLHSLRLTMHERTKPAPLTLQIRGKDGTIRSIDLKME